MPLAKGKSKKVIARNIAEFHHGQTYAHTAEKFGKARADSQAVAVAMREAGQARPRRPGRPKDRRRVKWY